MGNHHCIHFENINKTVVCTSSQKFFSQICDIPYFIFLVKIDLICILHLQYLSHHMSVLFLYSAQIVTLQAIRNWSLPVTDSILFYSILFYSILFPIFYHPKCLEEYCYLPNHFPIQSIRRVTAVHIINMSLPNYSSISLISITVIEAFLLSPTAL